ncbi:WLM domain-containing protein [Phialemonium atrogriseum]|uniref:WLM domain-containing protein n=1 Tax=Phialemonium atrogriseum TaxID=1093897 RepID=A0AAJ0BYX3_9PEZI|nr:WLM domain-containing protein [Phialemonium atrogriseum]KAK1767060.1 WLM domain-containing protein [Phialemonium atrogriseum]
MPEHDPFVLSYSHLKDFPREKEALHALRKVASLVKPIMRARGWVVRELAEFYPDQQNLLGLNVNRGQKILLRLRYPGDRTLFLPAEQVADTMLHELSHIVHGPHDAKFHALWNQLREEHEALVRKGYTGEGFLSDGKRLGGQRIPMHEARRLARAAAEKRRALSAGSGQRLGGAAPRPGEDMRRVIASAIERRNRTLQGCGNTNHNESEIREISDTASRNGFKTQAEEDAANEAAIAQALWELVQEDEKAKYGSSYIPPSAKNPAGNGGRGAVVSTQDNLGQLQTQQQHVPEPSAAGSSTPEVPPASSGPFSGWTCGICTLHNPTEFLCCDACGTERTAEKAAKRSRPAAVVDLTGSRAKAAKSKATDIAQNRAPAPPATWQCSFCGNKMERQWWTCSTCGKMKDSSR